NNKGKKIRVAKYKAKSRYRKVQGHRQLQSLVKILQIN
ncbi:MAG: bL21 family ribosomal protein, partial [Candidatus Pacebacteria bacterium]|nr:bL21 family ribosomal protein [Candidatus Paceibacterota bacterium]